MLFKYELVNFGVLLTNCNTFLGTVAIFFFQLHNKRRRKKIYLTTCVSKFFICFYMYCILIQYIYTLYVTNICHYAY